MNIEKRTLGIFVLVILFALPLCVDCKGDLARGKTAPDIIIGEWMTDNPPNVKNLKGKVYVVEFWATWCRPCLSGMEDLNKINKKYKDRGLVFISLCQDKTVSDIQKVINDKKINFHVAVDKGTADWFEVECYPTVAVVGHDGKVVWQGRTWDRRFEHAIEKAIRVKGNKPVPPPLLVDLDLGPFSNLEKYLYSGKGFSKAYREINSHIHGNKSKRLATAARKIVDTINIRVVERIRKAKSLKGSDPMRACGLYEELFASCGGIDLVDNARLDYAGLRKSLRD
ncbi:MAG: TlpA family protein disulfide reductase [Planctomycetes bacterium]|nr:TlpA family protein disulfide reductase [Planctomycetota bacterium]